MIIDRKNLEANRFLGVPWFFLSRMAKAAEADLGLAGIPLCAHTLEL
jgi:hypothetical protein